ncbi:hypothetical protein IFM89_029819 [Coptis chinensis]|uniref:Bet v I/Major latex protein domain-containing protein n=1 Tax=Coptis chinensis TaxID=261450 RepID=A0A835HN58_9MAGN|nr:hypothetical protein IFM89_029819 [Coptis chinensis]
MIHSSSLNLVPFFNLNTKYHYNKAKNFNHIFNSLEAEHTITTKSDQLFQKQAITNFISFGRRHLIGASAALLLPTFHSKASHLQSAHKGKGLLGEVSGEVEVDLPADEIWAVYSSPDLPRLIVELMPARFASIDILEGDGTQGTVLHCVLQPGNKGPVTWNEKITKIDHKSRTKVVRQIKGGYLDMGFNMYEHIFKITKTGHNSCTIRMTASFNVNEGSESNASLITANWNMAKAISNYVIQSKASKPAGIKDSVGTTVYP